MIFTHPPEDDPLLLELPDELLEATVVELLDPLLDDPELPEEVDAVVDPTLLEPLEPLEPDEPDEPLPLLVDAVVVGLVPPLLEELPLEEPLLVDAVVVELLVVDDPPEAVPLLLLVVEGGGGHGLATV